VVAVALVYRLGPYIYPATPLLDPELAAQPAIP